MYYLTQSGNIQRAFKRAGATVPGNILYLYVYAHTLDLGINIPNNIKEMGYALNLEYIQPTMYEVFSSYNMWGLTIRFYDSELI